MQPSTQRAQVLQHLGEGMLAPQEPPKQSSLQHMQPCKILCCLCLSSEMAFSQLICTVAHPFLPLPCMVLERGQPQIRGTEALVYRCYKLYSTVIIVLQQSQYSTILVFVCCCTVISPIACSSEYKYLFVVFDKFGLFTVMRLAMYPQTNSFSKIYHPRLISSHQWFQAFIP